MIEELTERARGNMLLKINGKNDNPTQTLILALQARGSKMTKDEDFYLAFMDGGVCPCPSNKATLTYQKIRKVVKILSGDPSRGALALETEEPLTEGQEIQVSTILLFHCIRVNAEKKYMYRDESISLPSPTPSALTFSALTRNEDSDIDVPHGEPQIVEGFMGFSEDGFVVGDGVCNVPFATASWA